MRHEPAQEELHQRVPKLRENPIGLFLGPNEEFVRLIVRMELDELGR